MWRARREGKAALAREGKAANSLGARGAPPRQRISPPGWQPSRGAQRQREGGVAAAGRTARRPKRCRAPPLKDICLVCACGLVCMPCGGL